MFLQVGETETRLECLLNNNKNSDFCAPLTSFDWNEVDPYLLGKEPGRGYASVKKQRYVFSAVTLGLEVRAAS